MSDARGANGGVNRMRRGYGCCACVNQPGCSAGKRAWGPACGPSLFVSPAGEGGRKGHKGAVCAKQRGAGCVCVWVLALSSLETYGAIIGDHPLSTGTQRSQRLATVLEPVAIARVLRVGAHASGAVSRKEPKGAESRLQAL